MKAGDDGEQGCLLLAPVIHLGGWLGGHYGFKYMTFLYPTRVVVATQMLTPYRVFSLRTATLMRTILTTTFDNYICTIPADFPDF